MAKMTLLDSVDSGSTPGPSTKTCGKCQIEKAVDQFSKSQSWCKLCVKEYDASRWRDDAAYRARRKASNAANLERCREYLLKFLEEHDCADCGLHDVLVFELDHVRGEKVGNISEIVRAGSIRKLIAELEKCEVVCANCHRRRTATTYGFWKIKA